MENRESRSSSKRYPYIVVWLSHFLKEKFSLDEDKASQTEVIENIRKGVEFKGTNLWVLIFATLVASLGLNVNSTAVIIGAMLISPLMGPIMGIGLSLGINDFELMKNSLRNFGFMVMVGIIASTFYFVVSPLNNAQSELLARTLPTTYDVLIAFFGGLAGIVAQSRKDRTSTVIPGVAIATALMPPLCTAGYGLATGQVTYFMGAFYLFFINTVFIAFATFFIVRFLKYDKKEFVDKRREQKVRRSMLLVITITIIPSVIIGYRIIQRTFFETAVDKYVNEVFKFSKTQVIDYKKVYDNKESFVDVVLMGEPLPDLVIENLNSQLFNYGLEHTKLVIHQSGDVGNSNFGALQSGYSELLTEKNKKITDLEFRLAMAKTDTVDQTSITTEFGVLSEHITDVAISKSVMRSVSNISMVDTVIMCVLKIKSPIGDVEQVRLRNWLSKRTGVKNVKLFIDQY